MAWKISGQYMETCNCDYMCPCPLTGLAESTHGHCIFAMGFRVDSGEFDGTKLDGIKFAVIGKTPGNMGQGNWEVGLIVDDSADQKQQEALGAIVGGQAGGPMANLAPLIGKFLGLETAPIEFAGNDREWSLKVGNKVDQAVLGAKGLGGEQLYLDNTGHPANNRFAIGTAHHSRIHAFGIDYEETNGRNNGQFASFNWRG